MAKIGAVNGVLLLAFGAGVPVCGNGDSGRSVVLQLPDRAWKPLGWLSE